MAPDVSQQSHDRVLVLGVSMGTKHENRRLQAGLAMATAGALSLFGTGAFGQEPPGPRAEGQVIEELVVTAQKRAQSISDVPATVTALTAEALREFAVNDLFEVATLVPGMVFSRAPDDGLALTLRGLGTPARTQSFDQSVALFQDGMFIGKGRMYSSAFFDVERMEIIKGTQSTLLGKNSSLGAISIVTRKPGTEFQGFVEASAEFENGGTGLDAAVDIPLGDSTALRLAAHLVQQDGWVENLLTNSNVPSDDDLGLRATLVSDPSDRLTITASFQLTDSERQGNGFQFVDNGNFLSDEVLAILGEARLDDTKTAICPECPNGESFHDTEVTSINLTIDYRLGEYVLTSSTSYATYDLKFFDDFDFGNAYDEVTYHIREPGTLNLYSTYFERDESYSQISQELRFTSPTGGKFDFMAGLFLFISDWTSSEQQFWRTPNFPPAPPPPSGNLFRGPFTNNFSQDTDTLSLFGHGTLHFSRELRLAVGLRYTSESKSVTFERVQGEPATVWNTDINPPFSTPLSFDDDFINGNLSLQWDATGDTMWYLSYGLGTKTGGFAESAEVSSGDPSLDVADNGARVKSEEATTIELGAKTIFAEGVATLNFALFQTDISDFQETSFQVLGAQAFFLTRNIDVASQGVEVDGQWLVSENLRLLGGLTYADSRNAGDDTELAQAPKLTAGLGLRFENPIGLGGGRLKVGSYLRFRDKMVSQINETFPSDSLLTIDFSLGFTSSDDIWSISLIGQNILDEVSADFSGPPAAPIGGVPNMAPPGDQGITSEAPSPLRSLRLQARYNF